MQKEYYLGLDIGTNSVGYAVTNDRYDLLKFHGQPAWGVTLFDSGSLNDERRSFRSARRRLDRRQQRVILLQELFAREVAKVDERFFIRLQESSLFRDDVQDKYIFFNEENYTDKDYFDRENGYPTIHHLINDLMKSKKPHDVRHVYLACAWLVAHRGHFLSNIDKNNLNDVKDFSTIYGTFRDFFMNNGYQQPWNGGDEKAFSEVLKKKISITAKKKQLADVLLKGEKASKEAREEFPFSQEAIIQLLAGGTCSLKDLFCNDTYAEYGSVSLGFDDEKLAEVMTNIGDDYELIAALRALYDWSLLIEVLGEEATISEAKVKVYEQHREDLRRLKYFIHKYSNDKYDEVFRTIGTDNYAAYVKHSDEKNASELKSKGKEEFSKYILGILKTITPEEGDRLAFEDMIARLEVRTFMPKQKNTDNRVIPYQLYWYELKTILNNVEEYLPFLVEQDAEGLSVADKIEAIFLFKISYFVGPLNPHSKYAWIERKSGKIYPWNFEQMVDLEASEQNFIQRMTNRCTYLSGEPVLPKDSLVYHKYMVLNEINNIRINNQKLAVEVKQKLYDELFLRVKKVTRKKLIEYLVSNGYLSKDDKEALSGIDEEIHSNLIPQIAFRRLLDLGIVTEQDAERIIERATYAEDKSRLAIWLEKNYPHINEADRKYICGQRFKDFGRLSRRFLCELEGVVDKETGEMTTVLGALWNTQNNLMELLSDRFTFTEAVMKYQADYFLEHKPRLEERLDEMYLSNAVKRPIYRTLDIVKDVKKAFGEPKKIFVEVTRSGRKDQKGKRTRSRKQQILDLYNQCKDEDVRLLQKQLEELGEAAESKLQGDKLFLYYMQLGKCMYTGERIALEQLATRVYDIDHIYPQAYVSDDSIINNKVLVRSQENGGKSDVYPIQEAIRHKMKGYWENLRNKELISEEKYRRLVRSTPFSDEEKYGFINRQIVETSQTAKAVATLLKEAFPNAEIVYSKASVASEFRNEFDIWKSRIYNDLHHAVDAYINIVTGNVYSSKFTKSFNVHAEYSIKTKTVFRHKQVIGGKEVWAGEDDVAKVKRNAVRNDAHFTKYATFKVGALFDQMPVSASGGLTPLKKGRDTLKYGGYNKAGVMFYIPVTYTVGKKKETIIMSVEMLDGERFINDSEFAREYSFRRLEHILGKPVDDVCFPMGMRQWKVNTMLSLDGFRACITGIASGGKTLILQPVMQFRSDEYWIFYLKKLEMLAEKIGKNPKYFYSEEYDKVSKKDNEKLYDLYIDKMQNSIYRLRVNLPVELLIEGKTIFAQAGIVEQVKTLLEIHSIFCRMTGGCDLRAIGGKPKTAATLSFSSTVSNWRKRYQDIRIIDSSVTGFWEKKSQNLLDIL